MASALDESMKTVIEIEGAEWEHAIRSATRPVLAHFHTSWCGQCRILVPSLEALAAELEDELQVAKVNLDHCPELARRYGFTDVPALVLFDNGAPIALLDPWMSPRQMKAHLQGLLADYATPSIS
jgi:thioredoxin-like negative regulator of GroEL